MENKTLEEKMIEIVVKEKMAKICINNILVNLEELAFKECQDNIINAINYLNQIKSLINQIKINMAKEKKQKEY